MNKIILVGNLTADPEYATTKSGISVAKATLAVNRNYKDENGNKIVDFHKCVFWRMQADILHKYCKKGDKIGIVGELQNRTFEKQYGTKGYVTEINVIELEFLNIKKVVETPIDETTGLEIVEDEEMPF